MKIVASVVLTLATTTDAALLRSKGTSTRRTAQCCFLFYVFLSSSLPLFSFFFLNVRPRTFLTFFFFLYQLRYLIQRKEK